MLLCVGLLSLDIVIADRRVGHAAGGTAANVAAMATWLGAQASIAARVGDGTAGSVVEADLGSGGVDMSALARETGPTCSIVHYVGRSGHYFSTSCPSCGRRLPRHRRLGTEHLRMLANRASCYETIFADRVDALLAAWLVERADEGKTIVFEPWRRATEPIMRTMLAVSHLVKVSADGPLVDALDAFPRRKGGIDIVTLGAGGVRWRVVGGRWQALPGTPVDAIDAAGAGDWLTAALLTEALPRCWSDEEERAFDDRLRSAQIVAARSVGYIGARGMMFATNHTSAPRRPHRMSIFSLPKRTRPGTDSCAVCLRFEARASGPSQ
jgi:sugar/nucleoside kinase (ribokinase family)